MHARQMLDGLCEEVRLSDTSIGTECNQLTETNTERQFSELLERPRETVSRTLLHFLFQIGHVYDAFRPVFPSLPHRVDEFLGATFLQHLVRVFERKLCNTRASTEYLSGNLRGCTPWLVHVEHQHDFLEAVEVLLVL